MPVYARCAMRNRRALGYFVAIPGNNSAHTKTQYIRTAVVRIVYIRECEKEFSVLWAAYIRILRTAFRHPALPLWRELRWPAFLWPLSANTSMRAFKRGSPPRFLIGVTREFRLRCSPPILTSTIGHGLPFLRSRSRVTSRRRRTPNYGYSYTTSDTRSSRVQIEAHQKHARIQTLFLLYRLLQLDLGCPDGRLPGRSEHPRTAGNPATYS